MAAPLAAQAPAERPLSGGGRELGGHTYVPLSAVPAPFTGTSFQTATGGSMAFDVIEAVIVDIGGQLDTLIGAGDLVFAGFDMGFQQRLGSRFAIRASAYATARGGTNIRLIYAEGLSGVGGGSLGGLMELVRDERRLLTATLDIRRSNLTEVTPEEFADYVGEWGVDSLEHWGEHLVHDRQNARLVGGLRGAWTVKPWLGLSGMIEVGPTNLYEEGGKLAVQFGLGASVQLSHLKGAIPVSLGLGFGRTRPPARTDDIFGLATTLNLGIFYTGHRGVALGLDIQRSTSKLQDGGESVSTAAGRIVMRFDF